MVNIIEAITPASNSNRPKIPLRNSKPTHLTIHETANTAPGATALMHKNFVWGGGGTEGVSFHYVVDDKEAYHLIPNNEKAWHAGDGANGEGNSTSLGIETCVNRDGNWNLTLGNLVQLVQGLMDTYNIPKSAVHQHNYYSSYHKDCPHNMRLNNNAAWNQVMAQLREPNSTPVTPPTPPTPPATSQTFPETGKTLRGEFFKFFNANGGIKIFGFPISEEFVYTAWNGEKLTAQWFERARFEMHTDGVKLGLVGREAMEAKK